MYVSDSSDRFFYTPGRGGIERYRSSFDRPIHLVAIFYRACLFVACCAIQSHLTGMRVGNVTVAPHHQRCLARTTSVLSWFWESQQCNVCPNAAGRDSADPSTEEEQLTTAT